MINRLREIRKKRNIKVESISESLNISTSYYYDLEKGDKRLNDELIIKFSEFYNVTTDYILGLNIVTDIPQVLLDAGIDYIKLFEHAVEKGLSQEDIKEVLEFAEKINKKNKKK